MIIRLEFEACMGSTFLGLLGGAGIFTKTIPIQPYDKLEDRHLRYVPLQSMILCQTPHIVS